MEYREEDEGLKGGVGSDSREEDDKKRDAECGVGEDTWKCEQTATVLIKKKEVRVSSERAENRKTCKVLFLPDGTCKERDASREARGGGRRTFHVFYLNKKKGQR